MKWTTRYKDSLPDSHFLIPKYRALPYKNKQGTVSVSHVRNALARADQVKGVPMKDINAAIKKGEKILEQHGGYQRNGSDKLKLHAQPHALDFESSDDDDYFVVKSFYFKDLDDYEKKYDKDTVEEYDRLLGQEVYEIKFISGDPLEQQLFKAMDVSQENLKEYFDALDMDEGGLNGMTVLMEELGMDAEEARERAVEVQLYKGKPDDYAEELIDDSGGPSAKQAQMYFDYDSLRRDDFQGTDEQLLARYFDYEAFARDMETNGKISVVNIDGTDYVFTNPMDF